MDPHPLGVKALLRLDDGTLVSPYVPDFEWDYSNIIHASCKLGQTPPCDLEMAGLGTGFNLQQVSSPKGSLRFGSSFWISHKCGISAITNPWFHTMYGRIINGAPFFYGDIQHIWNSAPEHTVIVLIKAHGLVQIGEYGIRSQAAEIIAQIQMGDYFPETDLGIISPQEAEALVTESTLAVE